MSILPSRSPRPLPDAIASELPASTTITGAEALERYPFIADLCEPAEANVERVVVYGGNVTIGAIQIIVEPDDRSFVVVDGDLFVEDGFTIGCSQDDDAYLAIFVTGAMTAADVAMSGDGKLWVKGDLDVENLVAAGGGSDGFLRVDGKLAARLVMATSDNQITAGAFEAVVVGSETAIHGTTPSYETAADVIAVFAEGALDGGAFDIRSARRAIAAGTAVLREDA